MNRSFSSLFLLCTIVVNEIPSEFQRPWSVKRYESSMNLGIQPVLPIMLKCKLQTMQLMHMLLNDNNNSKPSLNKHKLIQMHKMIIQCCIFSSKTCYLCQSGGMAHAHLHSINPSLVTWYITSPEIQEKSIKHANWHLPLNWHAVEKNQVHSMTVILM